MKRQIRKGVFETNSSSTHAICISKDNINKNSLPEHITFTHGEFGWEFDTHSDTWTKASYLYQAICDCNDGNERQEKLNKIIELLKKYDITCDFEPDKNTEWGDGYIDHAGETYELVDALLCDEDKLIRYLFGESFIITGNDNSDSYNDRMYVNEGEEVTEWGNYTNYGELKSEFDNYEVFEKGN